MKTHCMSETPEYICWRLMKQRCFNKTNKNYPKYGGCGITVCDEWRESFAAFFRDMGKRPSLDHTLDRFPNQRGNYEPGNCRWATRKEQCRNTRVNRLITAFGETRCVADWADDPRCSVSRYTIYDRLDEGWTPEDAILKPKQKGHFVSGWQKLSGVPEVSEPTLFKENDDERYAKNSVDDDGRS